MREEFSVSKSVAVDASMDSVWQVVADPLNMAIYLDTVIAVERVRDNLYLVREVVAPKREGNLTMNEYMMEVVEYKEKKSLMFRIYVGSGRQRDFGFRLEPKGKEKTILTCWVKTNFVIANNSEVDKEIDSIIVKIAKMVMEKPPLSQVSRYEGTF